MRWPSRQPTTSSHRAEYTYSRRKLPCTYIHKHILGAPLSFLRVCNGLFGSQQRQLTALNSSKVPLTKKTHTLARFAFVLYVCMCVTCVFVRQSFVGVLCESNFVKNNLLPKTRQVVFSKKRPLSENKNQLTKHKS